MQYHTSLYYQRFCPVYPRSHHLATHLISSYWSLWYCISCSCTSLDLQARISSSMPISVSHYRHSSGMNSLGQFVQPLFSTFPPFFSHATSYHCLWRIPFLIFHGFRTSSQPLLTRQAFAVLWAIVVYLICVSIGLLVLFSASLLSLSNRPSNPWDRFSRPVGLQARRIFIFTVAMYNTPYFFPPPFNLIQLIFIRLPVIALHLAGQKEPLFMRVVESMLWRCTVGFISGPLTGFWLWAR